MVNYNTFNHCNIKHIQVYDEGRYASISYACKDHNKVPCELLIPKMVLPRDDRFTIQLYQHGACLLHDFNHPYLECDDDGIRYYLYPNFETKRKMTLSEIEKKLGYKIELVDEDDSRE